MPILADKTFSTWIEGRYQMSTDAIMQSEVSEKDIADAYSEV
jgi:hypothetical protein